MLFCTVHSKVKDFLSWISYADISDTQAADFLREAVEIDSQDTMSDKIHASMPVLFLKLILKRDGKCYMFWTVYFTFDILLGPAPIL